MVRAQVQELVTAQPVMTPLWAAPEVGGCLPAHTVQHALRWRPATLVVLLNRLPAPWQLAIEGVQAGQADPVARAHAVPVAQVVRLPVWQGTHAAGVQVVRHERASIKADIWSYGILVWELISGQDITELQPLAIARQAAQRKVCPSWSRHACMSWPDLVH